MPEDLKRKFIGELLLVKGLITEEQLHKALEEQKKTGRRLASILIRLGLVKEEDVMMALAEQLGFPFIDLDTYELDPAALNIIPLPLIKKHQIIPLFKISDAITVAMSNPLDIEAVDELKRASNMRIRPIFATPSAIKRAIEHYYGEKISLEEAEEAPFLEKPEKDISLLDAFDLKFSAQAQPYAIKETRAEVAEALKEATLAPVVKLVDLFTSDAVKAGASDIHFEPAEDKFFVRFRIDGVLYDVAPPPKRLESAIISRLKIMAGMDIAEKRLPQDGRIKMKVENRDVDLRVATFPTVFGENLSIRILDKSMEILKLEDLGFNETMLKKFREIIHRPHGIMLVTGPTGSGKTTTLYAVLNEINNTKKNIMTLEDPVEYMIPRIRQSQINVKAGLTFAVGLRSILRQDPDIIMIGEIRDLETAQIAIHAALTGHLVFSTLHTNDAPSAPTRLIDMGVEPFLVASSLVGILAQRLVRRLCPACKKPQKPTKEEISLLASFSRDRKSEAEKLKDAHLYNEAGCSECRDTGYKGRAGIFELLIPDGRVKELIATKAPSHHIQEAASSAGTKTLREDGLEKALSGVTSLSEILRVAETV